MKKRRRIFIGSILLVLIIGIGAFASYELMFSSKAKLLKAMKKTVTEMARGVPGYMEETGLAQAAELLSSETYEMTGEVHFDTVAFDLLSEFREKTWNLELIKDNKEKQLQLQLAEEANGPGILNFLVDQEQIYFKLPALYDGYFDFSAKRIDEQYNNSLIGKTFGEFPMDNVSINFFPEKVAIQDYLLYFIQNYAMENKTFLIKCYKELEVARLDSSQLTEGAKTGYELLIPKEVLCKIIENIAAYSKEKDWTQISERIGQLEEAVKGDFRAKFMIDSKDRMIGVSFGAGTIMDEKTYESVLEFSFTGEESPFDEYQGTIVFIVNGEKQPYQFEKTMSNTDQQFKAFYSVMQVGDVNEVVFQSLLSFEKETKQTQLMYELSSVGGITLEGKLQATKDGKIEMENMNLGVYTVKELNKEIQVQLKGTIELGMSEKKIILPTGSKKLFELSLLDALIIGKKIVGK